MTYPHDDHRSALLSVLDDLVSELDAVSETHGSEALRIARADIAASHNLGVERVFDGIDVIKGIQQPASITRLRYYAWKHAFLLYQAEKKL